MGLKQIKNADRIVFLRDFTREILCNYSEKYQVENEIEIEKIRQKFIQPLLSQEEAFKRFIQAQSQAEIKGMEPSKFSGSQEQQDLPADRKQMIHREPIPKTMQIKNPVQVQKPSLKQETMQQPPKQISITLPQLTSPAARPGSGMKKIEPLLRDLTVLSIECPGPGKNILVKKYNQINITKVIMSQEEITEVINEYTNQARIPLVGGILKAAVGNSVISAVVSEFVGSRFIINRATPYSLLQK